MKRHRAMIFDKTASPYGSRTRLAQVFAATLCAATLCVIACQPAERTAPLPAPDGRVVLDLIAELPAATINEEAAILDLGEPAARSHLIAGWGIDEEDADGTYVWGLGRSAALSFFAADPIPVTLGLRCKPLPFEGAPDQTVGVAINGKTLGEISLASKLARYRLEIPAEQVATGQNRLDLEFGYHHRPSDVNAGSGDERDLAVRCYDIELDGLGFGGAPHVAASSTSGTSAEGAGNETPDLLELPVGTVLTYYFDHASSSDLVLGAVKAWGQDADDIRLLVRSLSAESERETTRIIDPGDTDGPLRIPLATVGPAIDRLQLAVVSERRGIRGGWLRRKLGWDQKTRGLTLAYPTVHASAGQIPNDVMPPDRDAADGDPQAPVAAPEVAKGAPESPNVIIYLIDTLRADHLGAYGYSRPTSPNIDRFAADGLLFENALAQSSWTRPAVVSLLTGLAPRSHGVNRRQDALSGSVDTLAELLAREGYETAGFVTNGNAGPDFALDQGFEQFHYLRESAQIRDRHRLSDHLNKWLFRWLENRSRKDQPFFLYAHATDPHVPYTPAEPFLSRFAPDADPALGLLDNVRAIIQGQREPTERIRQSLIDLYDAEIAFNDHHFGRLIQHLKDIDLYDSSLIVLVSDHGEEFLDHGGWEHGVTLYDEQLRVPLIMKLPREPLWRRPGGPEAGKRISATARQMDVVPTILDLIDIAAPAPLDGASLLGAAFDDNPDRASFAYLSLQNRQIRSITRRGWKLILDDSAFPRGRPLQLYGLEADPRETSELGEQRTFERELLSQLMRRWELELAQGARATGEQAEISGELRRQLEALGYL